MTHDQFPPDDYSTRPGPSERRPAEERSQRDPQRLPTSQQMPTRRIPRPAAQEEPEVTRQIARPDLKGKQRRTRQAAPPQDPSASGLYVPWWGFVIVILAVAAITCGLWWLVLANKGDSPLSGGPSPTPIFVVITSTPTLGPAEGEQPSTVTPAPTEQPTSTAEPTAGSDAPTAPAGPLQVGSPVIVTGTEGAGLAVRQGPGVDYTYFFVANDGDRFVIEDGPRTADGYVWWFISDPLDADRAGWAAENWLLLAEE